MKDQVTPLKPVWRIMVDQQLQLKFLDFCVHQDYMIEQTCEQWKKWQQAGKKVDVVQLDNAGKNKALN